MLENHQSEKAWCSGWIATSVESEPTHIVHLVAIQQHATFYAHHVVCKVTPFSSLLMIIVRSFCVSVSFYALAVLRVSGLFSPLWAGA